MVRSARTYHQRVMSFPVIFLLLLIAQEVSEAIIRKIKSETRLDKAVLQAMYGYYVPRKAIKFKNHFQVISFFLKSKKFTSHVINKLKVYTKNSRKFIVTIPVGKPLMERVFC